MDRITRSALVACFLLIPPVARAQSTQPRALTLDQALTLAHESNAGLRAVRERVEETERRSRVVFSNYLPRISTNAAWVGSNNTRGIIIPAGSLGNVPGLGPFPAGEMNIEQGGQDMFFAMTTAQQPVTQFFKIKEGRGVARADEYAGRAELRRVEQAVSIGVLKAYAGVLIASRRRDAAQERVAVAALRTTTRTAAVQSGLATSVATTEARLRALQARQELLESENEVTDLSYALADAVGLAGGTALTVEAPGPVAEPVDSLGAYVTSAMLANPEVLEAEAMVSKAKHGVGAAKTNYIPDIGLFAGHLYQASFPFFPKSTIQFGAIGRFTLLDFGARGNTLGERRAQLNAANRNMERVRGKVRGEVEAAYRKLARAREMAEVAREALALRAEALRMRIVQTSAGFSVEAEQREANADRLEAELNMLRAEMGFRIARAELEQAAGRLAR
jgi:outer membrane protein TolC